MPSSPGPWFTKIEYHSAFGPHVMLLPINTIDLNISTPENSTVVAWDASTPSWSGMVAVLCTVMASHFGIDTNFDTASLYSVSAPGSIPVYHVTVSIDVPGTDTSPGQIAAAQQTITARDTGGSIAKLVLLDFASNNIWGKFKTVASADIANIWDEWTALSNGWASRAGNRPNTLISTTRTLNEKLRRAYRLT